MNANITRKVMIITLSSFLTIFALVFIISTFINVNNDSMRGNEFYPSYPLFNEVSQPDNTITLHVDDYFDNNGVTETGDNKGYERAVYRWDTNKEDFTYKADIPDDGLYYIALDYLSLTNSVKSIDLSISVNGQYINEDAENIRLFSTWASESTEDVFDRYHNEVLSPQINEDIWQTVYLRDQLFLDTQPLVFELDAGLHDITIEKGSGDILLGDIHIVPMFEHQTYDEYSANHTGVMTSEELLFVEAENYTYKNDVSILPSIEKSPSVTPFYVEQNYLNTIGTSFMDPGQQITYGFTVEQSGYYNITLKYTNDTFTNRASFRTIYIDGVIPFQELQDYKFDYTTSWHQETLGDGDPFNIYLEAGTHYITLEASAGLYADAYNDTLQIIDEISDYALQLKRLTGGDTDTNREWNIEEFLPQTTELLQSWRSDIVAMEDALDTLKTVERKSTQLHKQHEIVLQKLDELLKDIDEIPHNLTLLNEGSNSISQVLSLMATDMITQPLQLDAFYIHSEDTKLPKEQANFLVEWIASMQVYRESANIEVDTDYDIDVWVNRSRYYINMMQQMTDTYFTPETGIKVRYSVMPNEGKLILANAANTQPDLALGVSGWLPYELGLRGAAADMRQFDGFYEVIDNFMPGSMLHMIHDDKVYGLPETQDFMVTFYREDIFESLGLEVPETYDEIIEILPTLQRYGMNYYLPLSAESALKGFAATSPFIYQYDATYYTPDGFAANIDTPEALQGIEMMIDLYTVYSLPLQTPNFYNHFREGLLPIGVANFNTYVQLLFAAPEIANKWNIALAPGVLQDDGITIRRDTTGTAQSSIIFEKSEKQEEAWELLKWWMSTEIQTKFTNDLLITFGDGFLWNSANINALAELPLDEDHLDIILEQLTHIHEVPKVPGGYKMERELSNVWNTVVFDGVDIRSAIDDAIILINRELERKYAEFGYMDTEGNVLKQYIIPTIDDVKAWQEREE